MKRYGDDFINTLNAAISDVWKDAKPKYQTKGKWGDKGTLRPVPVITRFGKDIHILTDNENGASKKIHTPLSTADRMEGFTAHWKYKEWTDLVVPRLELVINEYEKKISNSL